MKEYLSLFTALSSTDIPKHTSNQPSTSSLRSSKIHHLTVKMQFTKLILAAALSLATGTHAWAKDGNGVWTANNNVWRIAEGR